MRALWSLRAATREQRRRRLRRPAFFGTLRRTLPLSDRWGEDRGTAVDRYYVEQFLEQHRDDLRGRVLEVADTRYTARFGRDVTVSDILDVDAANTNATVVADLGVPDSLPENAYDCFVLTQTLQYVYDVHAAIRSVRATLATGGVVLATVPAVTRIARSAGVDGDYWRFTAAACDRLFREAFDDVAVESHGNVLVATAFLQGVAREELSQEELDFVDPFFPVLVTVRAVKR